MARQSTTPVSFPRTKRKDEGVIMSSGRAGVVQPVAYIPILPGDSASGRIGLDVQLAEMPKPLLNAVTANFQAWFVPKSAHPRFSGRDELMHAATGKSIKALGAPDRAPPPYYTLTPALTDAAITGGRNIIRALGLHYSVGQTYNTDLIDAFNLIYNFRLAAHSSRLQRRKYSAEDFLEAITMPPAFWPSSRLSRVVPDYERALVVGALDLDVIAGRLPVTGIGIDGDFNTRQGFPTKSGVGVVEGGGKAVTYPSAMHAVDEVMIRVSGATFGTAVPEIFAEMGGNSLSISLADIDKARTTQAFAKLRTAYAGNDATGFDNDDTIVALLMQGLPVPEDAFKRPWLLDSQRVPVGFAERFATDAANLDQSVTQGRASATLSLNVPVTGVEGLILVTVEILPERVDERMADPWLMMGNYDDLPNALRDVQRVEPVDLVLNRRIDTRHISPDGLYGYEPMNDKWNRSYTRLGGAFYEHVPGAGFKENRAAIWQAEIINPTYSKTHYLAPAPFPHDVFADMNADAFEIVARHDVTIMGLTQIGDVLAETNNDYTAVQEAG